MLFFYLHDLLFVKLFLVWTFDDHTTYLN